MSQNRNLLQPLLVALLAVGLIAPAAQAATVIVDGTNATGILGLAFAGDVYDVTFVDDTPGSNAVYGTPPTLDFVGSPVAMAAAVAVNDALNTSVAETVGPEFGLKKSEYHIGFFFQPLNEVLETTGGEFFTSGGNPNWAPCCNDNLTLDANNFIWAKFTTSVPEPGSAALLGVGLTGLIAVGRSRRRATDETA